MNIDRADSHSGGHDDGDTPAWIGQKLQMISIKIWPVFLLALASASALAVDVREHGFTWKGVGEGEVLLKSGKPDHEAFRRDVRSEPEKNWS